MKIKKMFLPIGSLMILPTFIISSCEVVTEDTPVKIDKTVYEMGKSDSFNNIFNILGEQNDQKSFLKKSAEEINLSISNAIEKDKIIQEKLRIYLFGAIFNSLNEVEDIDSNGKVVKVDVVGSRKVAVDSLKAMSVNSDAKKDDFKDLQIELNKINDIKIILSEKQIDALQSNWTWEMEFTLEEDSEIAKIIQGDSGTNKRGVFYKRTVRDSEEENARLLATRITGETSGELWEKKFSELMFQLEYQSSKWYWDNDTKIVKSIKLESNINPYSTDGTSGGFSVDDAKRTLFGIDFIQNRNSNVLYAPTFLFQTRKNIDSTFINSEWNNFLKFKKYKMNDKDEIDEKRARNILIDLSSTNIKYEKKI
ncbi:MAG: hypothetical protein KFW07_00285 [Mycoplasmataceae bacterium]|nr:hypothetical protein [Mycoplasmataceae bacterium]